MVSSLAAMRLLRRRLVPAVLATCLICLPAIAHAANNCAWITEATASGLLGGDAVGAFTVAAAGQPAVCTFTQQNENASRTLRMTVEVAADPHARVVSLTEKCGAGAAPITAIGNEALMCSVIGSKGMRSELVVGRVRDQVFTITISTTVKNDPILTRDALENRIYTAAELIAGNLF